MQRPDENKRQAIAKTAARLFGSRPFHKVTLDDVAARARVGKGTLYIYFKSKEDLYFSLIYDGFASLVQRLRRELGNDELGPRGTLQRIVEELVGFAFAYPSFFEVLRATGVPRQDIRWEKHRKQLMTLIVRTIRRGNRAGEFHAARPELTAVCVPGLVRSLMLFAPRGTGQRTMAMHIVRLVEQGLGVKRGIGPARSRRM